MELKDILTIGIALLGFFFGMYQWAKNQKLQKKKTIFKKLKKKTDTGIYCDHIEEKMCTV
jgi:hypothetical protein